jgi:hypothetical protein
MKPVDFFRSSWKDLERDFSVASIFDEEFTCRWNPGGNPSFASAKSHFSGKRIAKFVGEKWWKSKQSPVPTPPPWGRAHRYQIEQVPLEQRSPQRPEVSVQWYLWVWIPENWRQWRVLFGTASRWIGVFIIIQIGFLTACLGWCVRLYTCYAAVWWVETANQQRLILKTVILSVKFIPIGSEMQLFPITIYLHGQAHEGLVNIPIFIPLGPPI